jgi:hypothetical protein
VIKGQVCLLGLDVSRRVVDKGRRNLCSVDDVFEVFLTAAIISRVKARHRFRLGRAPFRS